MGKFEDLKAELTALALEYKQIKLSIATNKSTAQSKAAPLTAPKAQRKAILSKLKNLADQINALSAKTN